MIEYKVSKWNYVEELEDIMNYMVNAGWVFESITQPPKIGEELGTVTFSRQQQRIDEGGDDGLE